ncbi:MAG: acyltransferase [Candidatus Andeanibacterium colombiense]|uniref:Acyltransferase n=1 Tax=Candidatus Andeanibacterium colombiense TaxID=3121345 RepID=A0AAJ5X977_9SPHN|nr:MAG: acyltransferase [Sphingomonadaceae bacterium]
MAQKYRSIQVGRAFAALIVVLVHSFDVSRHFGPHGLDFPRSLSPGYAGVDLFFVISGFIICLVTDRPNVKPGPFLWRRAIRILPLYWLFTLLWFWLSGAIGHSTGPRGLMDSLLLAPLPTGPVLVVGWTLEQEFLFYFIVAALLTFRRLAWLPWVMAAISLAAAVWHVALPGVWDYRILCLYHVQFFFGVLLYKYRERIVGLSPALLIGGGALAFLAAGYAADHIYAGVPVATKPEGWSGLFRVTSFGLSSAMLLGGLLALERQAPAWFGSRAARFAVRLGDASYVLYLGHLILFGIVGSLIAAAGIAHGWAIPVHAATILATIGFALAFHHSVEQPFLDWAHRRRARLAPGAAQG